MSAPMPATGSGTITGNEMFFPYLRSSRPYTAQSFTHAPTGIASRGAGRLQLADRQLGSRRSKAIGSGPTSRDFPSRSRWARLPTNLQQGWTDARSKRCAGWRPCAAGSATTASGWLWYAHRGQRRFGQRQGIMTRLTFGSAATAASFQSYAGRLDSSGRELKRSSPGHWTAKLEYLYVDLGAIADSFVPAPGASRDRAPERHGSHRPPRPELPFLTQPIFAAYI